MYKIAVYLLVLFVIGAFILSAINILNQVMIIVRQYGLKTIIIDVWEGEDRDSESSMNLSLNPCLSVSLPITY